MENVAEIAARRMVMLIDGDNAQPSLIEEMLAEASKYGVVSIRRIYGDWTQPAMKSWKDTLQTHAIQPIQQFRYTTGKNATDSALIIDAMDILYTTKVDGFCLVSSDSDYTRLATRVREKGVFVMGIGKKTTPRAFVNGCDVFVFTENLEKPVVTRRPATRRKEPAQATAAEPVGTAAPQAPAPAAQAAPQVTPSAAQVLEAAQEPPAIAPDPIPGLRAAFEMAVQDDGWACLGPLGQYMQQLDPSFDSRTYGYKQLSHLIRAYPAVFKVRTVRRKQGTSVMYVKLLEGGESD